MPGKRAGTVSAQGAPPVTPTRTALDADDAPTMPRTRRGRIRVLRNLTAGRPPHEALMLANDVMLKWGMSRSAKADYREVLGV